VVLLSFRRIYSLVKITKTSIIEYKLVFVTPAVIIRPPIEVSRSLVSNIRISRYLERFRGSGIVDRVSFCSRGEGGVSARCGRVSSCSRAESVVSCNGRVV
jgi:hypothetical protein